MMAEAQTVQAVRDTLGCGAQGAADAESVARSQCQTAMGATGAVRRVQDEDGCWG